MLPQGRQAEVGRYSRTVHLALMSAKTLNATN